MLTSHRSLLYMTGDNFGTILTFGEPIFRKFGLKFSVTGAERAEFSLSVERKIARSMSAPTAEPITSSTTCARFQNTDRHQDYNNSTFSLNANL
jgi:hypothetical protein